MTMRVSLTVNGVVGEHEVEPRLLLVHYLREVSGFACAIGFIWALFNKEKQTWHDLAANTVVVPTSAYPPPA